jgi:phosphopantothenoylcysteine decarboxylase/phosphopantothenate--cysteine ligase
MGARVVLAVTGSIAAFKGAALASDLIKADHEVQVLLSAGGAHFVSALTFEGITGRPVPSDVWDEGGTGSRMGHIEMGRWADILVVAPASAGAIARLALGLPSDMLGALALSAACPLLIAPAMETGMWEHPATRDHVAALRSRGATFVGPASGRLASGASGAGRMAEPDEIRAEIERILSTANDLAGVRVLVTAGPTFEAIDPVRFIGNRSSGKMGYAVAQEARDRGAHVVLVSGPSALRPPAGVEIVPVESHQQMSRAVLERARDQDVIVMAAAIADFAPAQPSDQKLKRQDALTLELTPTSDISAEAVAENPDALHIGFALETGDLVHRAQEKMLRKGQDMVVANGVGADHNPFGADTNRVAIITREGITELPERSKRDVARHLWDVALRLRPQLGREHCSDQ